MADTTPIYPAFFRIFLSELHSERMEVPPEFLKYLEEVFSTDVIIIGSSGYQWQVTISKDEKVYMQNGWPQVLADNSVKSKELLLFTYNGQNRFLVQFFSCNGCERQCTKTIKHEEAATPNLVRTKKRDGPRRQQKGLPTSFLNQMKECDSSKECKRNSQPENKYPDFFKVFLPKQHSERMLIPNAFMMLARQQGWEPRNLTLKNFHGKVWEVKALPINNQLYFGDGWKQFREDNCLKAADFVFFTHVGGNVFNFKICESTGCEKTKVNVSGEQEKERDDVIELDEEEKERNDVIVLDEEEEEEEDDDDDDDDDDDYDEDEDEDEGEDEDDDDEDDDDEEEEEEEEECKATMRRQSPGKASKVNSSREKGGSSGTKADEDADIDVEMYIQPDNPYFINKPWKTKPNDLHIPYTILKDFSPLFDKKITLVCCPCRNTQRNELQNYHLSLHQQQTPISRFHTEKGEVTRWTDGRVCVKGWLSFRRKNKIQENDACICEIVWQEHQAIEMIRVHVAKKK